jgi:hypothetical protein
MERKSRIIGLMPLVMSLMLLGCAKDGAGGADGGDQQVEVVNVRFAFSMFPQHSHRATTRMDSAIVNPTALADGLEDARMLCFNGMPTSSSKKIGEMIEFKNLEDEIISSDTVSGETSGTEVSEFRQVGVPVGTTHFGFYGKAPAASSTHEDRMKNGIIEVVGLSKSSYQGNSGIRFKPVQICKSAADFGGSTAGAKLLDLLNELMAVTSTEAAPNDRWETAGEMNLNEAYQRMIELKTLSSQHVALMLARVYLVVSQAPEGEPGRQLADAIKAKIASVCNTAPTLTSTMVDLKEEYQNFPSDIHLPMGAARIMWDDTQKKFVVPDVQAYGKQLDIASMNDYCYPMNLQYQVLSDILASDTEVAMPAIEGGETLSEQWQQLIDDLYSGASTMVQQNTKSVAMKQQVNYAVGKLALKTRIASSDNMYDAKGKLVNVSNGFTLKGYIIGGQREVDYNFQPVAGSKEYAIYDTSLNGGPQEVKRHYYTKENFVLGLGTAADKDILIALELVNNGDDFQGADGVIVHGATFYLVANLVPHEGLNYSSGSIDQVFSRDKATTVTLTIEGGYPDTDGDGKPDPGVDEYGRVRPLKGLATATYGLPNLEIPKPTVGLSVNLSWEEGLWYEEIELF